MTNSTRKWVRAGVETFIHGGCAAVTGAVSVNVIDPKDWGASIKTVQLMGIMFLINGGLRFFQWWQNNPLPPDSEPGTAMISVNPLAKVTPQTTFSTKDEVIVDANPAKP